MAKWASRSGIERHHDEYQLSFSKGTSKAKNAKPRLVFAWARLGTELEKNLFHIFPILVFQPQGGEKCDHQKQQHDDTELRSGGASRLTHVG